MKPRRNIQLPLFTCTLYIKLSIEMIIALLLRATKVPNNLPFNQRTASSNYASTPVLVVVILSKHVHTQNVINALRGSNFNFLELYLYAFSWLHCSYAPDVHDKMNSYSIVQSTTHSSSLYNARACPMKSTVF